MSLSDLGSDSECSCYDGQVDNDTMEMLRGLNMANLPGVKVAQVRSPYLMPCLDVQYMQSKSKLTPLHPWNVGACWLLLSEVVPVQRTIMRSEQVRAIATSSAHHQADQHRDGSL